MKNKVIQKFFTILLGLMMVSPGWAMSGSSSENMAGQGNPFTNAYDYSFTTSGTTVNISFTEHDNYTGLEAYLWNYTNGFAETKMNVSEHTATIALTNQTPGTKLTLACKFAYAGGMSVTKKFEYTVEGGDTPTPPTPPTTGVDWDNISWVPNSSLYKIANFTGTSIVNVQTNWGHEGIYVTFPNAVTSCSLGTDGCHIEGAGLLMYLSAFTAKETEVTVVENGVSHTFVVYYANGTTEGGGDTPEPEPTGNLFDPAKATITTSFNNWDWADDNTSTASYDAATGKITTNIDGAKNAQWQAQVKLNTGLTTLDVTKNIYFTCKMKANVAFNGSTIKMFDNNQIYYKASNIMLPANEEVTISLNGGKAPTASANGIIVFDFGYAPANTTIEIYDIEIGYGEVEVIEPTAAPTAPTWAKNQVKAIYSSTYSTDCGFDAWGSETFYAQDTYGKKFVTNSNGYFGLVGFTLNCSTMEKLHIDAWFPEAGSFRIVPILRDPSKNNYPEQGVTVTVGAEETKQWKSIDIALTEGDWKNYTDWSDVYQIKIDNAADETFWLNNIYFYTTQEQEPEVITETTWWDEIRMVTINNVDYAVLCSVTRHENKTITFHIETTGWIDGLVPQVFINGAARNLNGYTAVNWKADYTTIPTDGTFETDDVLTCHLYFAYAAGGVATLPDFSYTVGAENDKPAIAVTGVVIDQTAPAMAIGDKLQLTATVNPVFVDNKNVTWSTTNASAVTVTDGGLIEAVGAGEATIRATSVADNTKYGELVITVQAVLESASYYGTGFFQSQLDQSYVAYNYNFTRAANHEVTLTVVFERDVTSYIEAGNFQFFENGQMHQMTYTAATKTATYSFGNKADGSEIVNFYFYFVLTGGGVAQTEAFTYTVGSTNEQPNKLIALNEVVANTLTDDETVDAIIARTFEAGNLYTLALPFDMTADQVAETFGTCTMYKLEDSYWKVEGENMYIRFAPVTEFKANTPILFTPATDLDNIVAKEVTINNAACATATTLVTFHGTYSKMNLTAPYYILADDQYLYPVVNDDYYINGMRGYFSFGSGSKAPKMARIILHEEITTDNAFLRNEKQEMRAKKVLENGRFVIIRDGARYGVLGVEE